MCDCKARINEILAPHNTQLAMNLLNDRDIFVETTKLDEKKRGKRKYMFASFCPFCGDDISPAEVHQDDTGVERR